MHLLYVKMFILLPAEVVMQILEPNKVLSVENNTTFSVSSRRRQVLEQRAKPSSTVRTYSGTRNKNPKTDDSCIKQVKYVQYVEGLDCQRLPPTRNNGFPQRRAIFLLPKKY